MTFDNNDLINGAGGGHVVFELRSTIFDPFSSLKTHFLYLPTRRDYFLVKLKFRMFLAISLCFRGFKLLFKSSHSTSKQTKICTGHQNIAQNSFHFLPEL